MQSYPNCSVASDPWLLRKNRDWFGDELSLFLCSAFRRAAGVASQLAIGGGPRDLQGFLKNKTKQNRPLDQRPSSRMGVFRTMDRARCSDSVVALFVSGFRFGQPQSLQQLTGGAL